MTDDKGDWLDLFAEQNKKPEAKTKAATGMPGKRAKYEPPIERSVREKIAHWRRTRPFWGAVLLAIGGWLVISPVVTAITLIAAIGVQGITVWMLGGGMITVAAVSLFLPAQRHFPAIMGVFFSVASLPLANLGGWIVGMTLGIIGSGMIFAWSPYTADELIKMEDQDKKREARKEARRQAKQVKNQRVAA